MGNIDWKSLQAPIQTALDFFKSQGVRPTLRTLYYNLVSKNLIGNTKSIYKGMSKFMVQLRKDGVVPWDAIEDNARNVYGEFKDDRFEEDIEETNEATMKSQLERFNPENILKEFFDYYASRARVDRWADQPNVAEIWIEKEALAKTIAAWTERFGVKVRVNKGYSSWTFIYENAQELEDVLARHTRVYIFYLGDLDPSGKDMERYLKEALQYFGLDDSRIELVRLSITEDQVRQFNLPPKPEDAETLAKLQRDSRMKNYDCDFIVELDAMVAFVPQEFRQLIIDAIRNVFDQGLYDKLREEAEEHNEAIQKVLNEAKAEARKRLKEFTDKADDNDDTEDDGDDDETDGGE